jgi:hypothetical protein
MKSRKVVGQSVDNFVDGKFQTLENTEKNLVWDSLHCEGDLEDARENFQRNIEHLALSDDQCEELVGVLSDLIKVVIEHYESRLGPHSTRSLVEVTMNKVMGLLEPNFMDFSNILNILPSDYFGKWVTT